MADDFKSGEPKRQPNTLKIETTGDIAARCEDDKNETGYGYTDAACNNDLWMTHFTVLGRFIRFWQTSDIKTHRLQYICSLALGQAESENFLGGICFQNPMEQGA